MSSFRVGLVVVCVSCASNPGADTATASPSSSGLRNLGLPPSSHTRQATPAKVASDDDAIQNPWNKRNAIAVADLQTSDPAFYERIRKLRPNQKIGKELQFSQPELDDTRATPVLLQRLMEANEPVPVQLALVDALPATGGDWHEAVATLAALHPSAQVRKKLVETLRYVPSPHNLRGLRLAFHDDDNDVRVAAARTTSFTRNGVALGAELLSACLDEDWDMRVAAVQALGQLRVRGVEDRLRRMLSDPHPEVRLQVLIALEHIDPEGVGGLTELDTLARDRHRQIAELAKRLRRGRPVGGAQASPGGSVATSH